MRVWGKECLSHTIYIVFPSLLVDQDKRLPLETKSNPIPLTNSTKPYIKWSLPIFFQSGSFCFPHYSPYSSHCGLPFCCWNTLSLFLILRFHMHILFWKCSISKFSRGFNIHMNFTFRSQLSPSLSTIGKVMTKSDPSFLFFLSHINQRQARYLLLKTFNVFMACSFLRILQMTTPASFLPVFGLVLIFKMFLGFVNWFPELDWLVHHIWLTFLNSELLCL